MFDIDVNNMLHNKAAPDVQYTGNQATIDLENRIKQLEDSINLKSDAVSSEAAFDNGLGRIRTGDLRRVRATS